MCTNANPGGDANSEKAHGKYQEDYAKERIIKHENQHAIYRTVALRTVLCAL